MVLPPALLLLYRTGFDWSAWETKVRVFICKAVFILCKGVLSLFSAKQQCKGANGGGGGL